MLTALASLAVLRELSPARRTIAASLVGLPYLAASFLAQSAFKETAMALFVVGFAVGLSELRPSGAGRESRRAAAATVISLGLLALASVLAFSLAGLVWPVAAAAIWLAVELATGRIALSPRRAASALRPLWPVVAGGLVVLAVIAAAQAGSISNFFERLGDIQASTGRLFSSVSPREALGIWTEGDFRTDASGDAAALLATVVGLAGFAFAAWWWSRRRDLAVPATLAAAALIYVGARVLGGIHVEAKALAVMAPVAMLFVLRALLAPAEQRGPHAWWSQRSPWCSCSVPPARPSSRCGPRRWARKRAPPSSRICGPRSRGTRSCCWPPIASGPTACGVPRWEAPVGTCRVARSRSVPESGGTRASRSTSTRCPTRC